MAARPPRPPLQSPPRRARQRSPSCCAFLVDGLGDAADQALGHVVLAPVGDDLAQLGLELGRAAAGSAEVQVLGDLQPARSSVSSPSR
jgi:hypothetical protein